MIELLVGEVGTLILFVAGISYVAVGIYLLQTVSRENGGPSFFLGLALLCNGFSFGFSEIPYIAGCRSIRRAAHLHFEDLSLPHVPFRSPCSRGVSSAATRVGAALRSGSPPP